MSGRVCAIVVTYNRRVPLRAGLLALGAQTRPPDALLVVDNASDDGTRALLRAEFPGATVLALAANGGGAGGFHAGMRWAYGRGFEWLWVMDDDARPAPDCLEKLLAHAPPGGVAIPVQQDSGGRRYGIAVWRGQEVDVTAGVVAKQPPVYGDFLFRFVGPLIAREIVARVGLPNKDFFIWFDDLEYALRIHGQPKIEGQAEMETVAVPDARFFHDFGGKYREARLLWRRSVRNQQPAWKLYYGARNHLYTLIRGRHDHRELLTFLRGEVRFIIGEMLYEPDRWERVRMRLLGYRDGVIGRLGKRI